MSTLFYNSFPQFPPSPNITFCSCVAARRHQPSPSCSCHRFWSATLTRNNRCLYFLVNHSVTLVFLALLARSLDVDVRLGFLAHLSYRLSSSKLSGTCLVSCSNPEEIITASIFALRLSVILVFLALLARSSFVNVRLGFLAHLSYRLLSSDSSGPFSVSCPNPICSSTFRNSCFSGSPCLISRRERQAWLSGSLELSFVVVSF